MPRIFRIRGCWATSSCRGPGTGTLWSSGTWRRARFGRGSNLHHKGLEGGDNGPGGRTLTRMTLSQGFRDPPGLGSQGAGCGCGERRRERWASIGGVDLLRRWVPVGTAPFPPKTSEEAGTGCQGWEGKCATKSEGVCQRHGGWGGGKAPKRDDKLVTAEASTSPDGGDSSAEEGARERASEAPAARPRGAPAGDEAMCVSSASDGDAGGGEGVGTLRYWREATSRRRGVQTPSGAGYPKEGEEATCGSCREYASARVAAGGREEDAPEGVLLVAYGVCQGQDFRVEGEAQSDPRWPALVQCLAELARVALWLAPRLRVDLLRLLGRCPALAERVFTAAEDWETGEIVTRFWGVLGDMTEDAFESLANLGTFPRPKKASISEEILHKGLGEMGNCPIPSELWDELVPAGLPERLRGVRKPEGKGYPIPEMEVMLEVLKGLGFFAEVHLQQGEQGGPNCTPFVIPKDDIKASMIMDCTPGNAPLPPPSHFGLLDGVGEVVAGLWGGGGGNMCMTHVDLFDAFWSFLLPAGSEGMFRFRFGGKLWV